jgi:pimeloyl-ACP methyl ester carboxylesterase
MENLTLHDFARDLAAVLEHEKCGTGDFSGHAFGHFVAKMTAVDFPKLTRGVILIGASQKTPTAEVRQSVAIASDPSQARSRAPQAISSWSSSRPE